MKINFIVKNAFHSFEHEKMKMAAFKDFRDL